MTQNGGKTKDHANAWSDYRSSTLSYASFI